MTDTCDLETCGKETGLKEGVNKLGELELNKIYCEDAIEFLKKIPDNSVDLILCDLPYGQTSCEWDKEIDLEKLWKEYKRILKKEGNIVLTTSQPFTSKLVMNDLKMFKYEWIWQKAVGSNFATLKFQPMKEHENILVFGYPNSKYFPIKEERKGAGLKRLKTPYFTNSEKGGDFISNIKRTNAGKKYDDLRFPSSIQFFNNRDEDRGLHPTQKPVALFEYLIKTYTNEGDLVVDNCIGGGTTAIACKQLGRRFIGCDISQEYVNIANKRLSQEVLTKISKEYLENAR